VHIEGLGTDHNVVLGNFIGTDATGIAAAGNGFHGVAIVGGAQYNLVGGAAPSERNIISGNAWDGVFIHDSGTMYNTVGGNFIGTDASGTAPIANGNFGVNLGNSTQKNLIGGTSATERNLISGNRSGGVNVAGSDVRENFVKGNYVGTDASGTAAIGNIGIGITLGSGAHDNLIGGTAPGERNLISGNGNDAVRVEGTGTMSNTVSGNYIGSDVRGMVALGNSFRGVFILDGAQYNVITGNVISGNGNDGVPIEGTGTMYNTVRGNYIGTDKSGTAVIGNALDGVYIAHGAQYNVITNNHIAGNLNGVQITASGTMHNTVSGNYIGTGASGTLALGNLLNGIVVGEGARSNIIGPRNVIAHNGGNGVLVHSPDTLGNRISGNSIHHNTGLGIENAEGGNAELSPPIITYVGTRIVRGSAPPNSSVEVFSDEGEEGRLFQGSTLANEEGIFTFGMPVGRFTGPHVTATTADADGNTSQFSSPQSPPVPILTRELPGLVGPRQVSIEPGVVGTNLVLALFCVLFFGLTSTTFDSILKEYRDELLTAFGRFVPRSLAGALGRAGSSLRAMTERGRGRLLLMWLAVLLVTSLIESFLDPEVGVLSLERLGILLTLFLSAVAVSGLELGSDVYAYRRLTPTVRVRSEIQWIGIAIAVACVVLSRSLDFKPGYLYGIVGATYLMPKLTDTTSSGKRAVFVLLTILAGGLVLWTATAFLPAGLAELEPLFLTIFLISLQGVFFELLPLAVTDGADIWSWRRSVWFVFFTLVFFCFYHFLLNPNASDVQALQQNGVQTLLILVIVFGLATIVLWLLFPFRLGRRRANES